MLPSTLRAAQPTFVRPFNITRPGINALTLRLPVISLAVAAAILPAPAALPAPVAAVVLPVPAPVAAAVSPPGVVLIGSGIAAPLVGGSTLGTSITTNTTSTPAPPSTPPRQATSGSTFSPTPYSPATPTGFYNGSPQLGGPTPSPLGGPPYTGLSLFGGAQSSTIPFFPPAQILGVVNPFSGVTLGAAALITENAVVGGKWTASARRYLLTILSRLWQKTRGKRRRRRRERPEKGQGREGRAASVVDVCN
ncbi:hypothetical protein DFH09DRAFT_1333254 [Mycena vulgaris]|nr:hypothetical protein DFH09DRAFT_1333254 [Mycena vulgaris]